MFIDFTQHFARRRKPDQNHVLFNCVCVPGRIWLWQNVVNNGPSIEATRQAIQRDLGTWTARYVHLLLQGGAPYSYGP